MFIIDSFEESVGSDTDPTFTLGEDEATSDESNISSGTEDNVQYNDNVSVNSNETTSDWEDNYDNIEDFGFDENNIGCQFDIHDDATSYDVFVKLWDDEVMQLILTSTNKYREKKHHLNRPHTKNLIEISMLELQKIFGLCLLRAELGIPVLRQCFGTDPLNYHPIFPYTMSGRRFEQILGTLNCSEGVSIDKNDRLAKISPLLLILIKKFQTSYFPSTNLSLDESMVLWRGRLIFRQYMKNKRHKYRIKFYELCTTDGYVLLAEMYKGKNVENTSSSKVNDLVLRLMKNYLNKGHHLFMDNFYNSVGLSKILLQNKTHTTGTLRSNRKLNPTHITSKTVKLKKGEYKFARKGSVYICR